MKLGKLSIIFSVLIYFGCIQNKTSYERLNDERLRVSEFYDNGILGKQYNFRIVGNDTIVSGPFKEFYDTGNLKSEGNYLNGMKDGMYKSYYPNGFLDLTGYFLQDDKVGPWFYFRDSSISNLDRLFSKNATVRERVVYFLKDTIELSKSLIGYEFYGGQGRKIYQQNYLGDSMTYDKGYHGPGLLMGAEKDLTFSLNDTLLLLVYCNNPPGYTSKHKYYIEGITNDWVTIKPSIPANIEDLLLNKKGDFEILATSVHEKLKTQQVYSDTNRLSFSVIEN